MYTDIKEFLKDLGFAINAVKQAMSDLKKVSQIDKQTGDIKKSTDILFKQQEEIIDLLSKISASLIHLEEGVVSSFILTCSLANILKNRGIIGDKEIDLLNHGLDKDKMAKEIINKAPFNIKTMLFGKEK